MSIATFSNAFFDVKVRQICHIALKRDHEYINTVREGSEETHTQVCYLYACFECSELIYFVSNQDFAFYIGPTNTFSCTIGQAIFSIVCSLERSYCR